MFDTLNMLNFDVTKKCLVGEGWCPIFAKVQVHFLHCNIFHEIFWSCFKMYDEFV